MRWTIACLLVLLLATTAVHSQGKITLRITTERQQKVNSFIKKQGQLSADDVKSSTLYIHPIVRETTQDVSYSIKIQNGGSAVSGLVVKYALFGRDRATQGIRAALQDQTTVDIKPLQTVSVPTKPGHFSASVSQYGHGYADSKEGNEPCGVGVAVYVGQTRVATYYDPPGLERQARRAGISF